MSSLMRQALLNVEWSAYDETGSGEQSQNLCPLCGAYKLVGHDADCIIGMALAKSEHSPVAWMTRRSDDGTIQSVWLNGADAMQQQSEWTGEVKLTVIALYMHPLAG